MGTQHTLLKLSLSLPLEKVLHLVGSRERLQQLEAHGHFGGLAEVQALRERLDGL